MSETIKMRKRTYWTTETFKEEMKKRNPNIEILGEYTTSKSKILCMCLLDGHEWYSTPNSLLKGCGCPKCSGHSIRTQDEFNYDLSLVNPDIEVIGSYINSFTKINVKCKKDGYTWYALPSGLLRGVGCPKCGGVARKTTNEFILELSILNKNIEVLGEYINNKKRILCRCLVCGYDTWYAKPNDLLTGHGCPCCSHRICVTGINDIATTHPHLIKYFVNVNDSQKYSYGSQKKVLMKCPDCGHVKQRIIKELANVGFACNMCSKGLSYPNKFLRCFLNQIPEIKNVIYEYKPNWANGRMYDGYFEFNNKKYLVEMDGYFHYKDNYLNGESVEKAKLIDLQKDKLAEENNHIMIRINCLKSNKQYIKTNIKNSLFNILFNLEIVDWDVCDEFATKNIVKEVCEYFNKTNYSAPKIAQHFNIGKTATIRFLNKGTELGWCNYCGSTVSKIMNEPMIAKDRMGNVITSAKNVYEMIENLNAIYPDIIFSRENIRNVCKNKFHTHRGLVFEYTT